MQQRGDGHVVHQLQARIAERDEVAGVDAEQLPEDLAQLFQTGDAAVIAGVGAGRIEVVAVAGQAEQAIGHDRAVEEPACRG